MAKKKNTDDGSSFLSDLIDELGDDFVSILSDGEGAAEFTSFIDTGCYLYNAQLSGTIFGGFPNNKIFGLGGDPATGKTFIALSIVKSFLASNPKAMVIYFDTEAAVTRDMFEDRGIDSKRVLLIEPDTIQKFRHKALQVIDAYEESPTKNPVMFVLDSLGMLSTTKELEDTSTGSETRDMTKAQVTKATFRVLTLRLAKAGIPMIVTNHVYAVPGAYVPTKVMGNGSGLLYAASLISFLSKKKERDKDRNIIGVIITSKMEKSRMSKENTAIDLFLSYTTGLDRYYGLLDFGEKRGILKRPNQQSYEFPDGTKAKTGEIKKNPEKYFTPEVLQLIDAECLKVFKYGKKGEKETEELYDTELEDLAE